MHVKSNEEVFYFDSKAHVCCCKQTNKLKARGLSLEFKAFSMKCILGVNYHFRIW